MSATADWNMQGIAHLDVPELKDGMDLWRVSLDPLTGEVERGCSWLSQDEQERARRFHFERDRVRFILGRASLRWILSQYLDAEPVELEFVYGPAGKPSLVRRDDGRRIHFNFSHSEELAVCAVSVGHDVGVDVERVREIKEAEEIMERHFSPAEIEHWRRLPLGDRPKAFFRSWVRHEARVKRSGLGLSGLREEREIESMKDQVLEFVPAPGFVAALAW